MTATLVDSDVFGFADGSGGHVIDLGSAPSVGQLDVLCVNSNTVVTTPSGFTAAPSQVGNQGAYIYRRIAAGGEGSTVTITTSGNHDTAVVWSRWGNIEAADDAIATSASSNGTSTPAHSTNALAETNELVVAFGALHSFPGSNPTTPVWSSGYTALGTASSGTGSPAVVGFVGYKLTAGTAAESPQVSWTNNAADRDMLTLTFTTSAANPPVALGQAVESDTATALTRSKSRALGQATETDTATVLGRSKARAIGQAAEVDTAQPLSALSVVVIGQAVETDTASALGRSKARALGQSVEVDTAGTVRPPGGAVRDLNLTVGRPQTKWHVGAPAVNWRAGRPEV
jgi:hypothetical protein